MRRLSNFVIKYSLYGLVFLLPLFWLPFTFEPFEFNKQYLLVFLVSLGFLAWLVKMIVVQKKIVWRRTPLDIPVLVFMAVVIFSAVYSQDNVSSWLGFYGRFSDSLAGLLALLVMYFLITQNSKLKSQDDQAEVKTNQESFGLLTADYKPGQEEEKTAKNKKTLHSSLFTLHSLLNCFLFSASLAVLAAYFSIFGLWTKLPWLGERLPKAMGLGTFNPVGGGLEGLAVFLAAAISLLAGMILNRIKNKKFIIQLLPAMVLLIIIDFWPAWLALGGTMLILLVIAFWTRMFRERANVLILPIILAIISVAGFFGVLAQVRVMVLAGTPLEVLPQEVILDYQTGWLVALKGLKEYPVLGSGPGTFLHSFTRFKPEEFNQNKFWNIRFDKGPSHLMDMISAGGILGILSYLGVSGIFLLVIFMLWRAKQRNVDITGSGQDILLLFFIPWLALFIAQFVYSLNTALNFSFWLFTALSMVVWQNNLARGLLKKSFSFKKLPEIGLVMSTLLIILTLAVLGLFYLAGRFYLADVYYQKGLNQPELEKKLTYFEKAVSRNKYRLNYRSALSQVYLISAFEEVFKPENERNVGLLEGRAAGAIAQAKEAAVISPNLVMSWENAGAIYRDLRNLVGGALSFSADAFKRALALEPTNPFLYRELCRINLLAGAENWDEVLSQCQKAVDLKPNFLDAHIQLALAYERKGDLEEAIGRMSGALKKLKGVSFERGSPLAGAVTEIYFQLGRLYFNVNNFDRAIALFEQAVIVTPEHANGRYALGLAYQKKGRNQDALVQFQIVNQLVPANAEVEGKIKELAGP